MAALVPDERWVVSSQLAFLLPIEMLQAMSGTSASTYKLMESGYRLSQLERCLALRSCP